MYRIIDAKPLSEYKVWIKFSDGTEEVEWPGGLDLCPDTLYSEITGKEISRFTLE